MGLGLLALTPSVYANDELLPWYYRLTHIESVEWSDTWNNTIFNRRYIIFEEDGLRGLKNSDGEIIIPAIYKLLMITFDHNMEELFFNALTETGWGLVDLRGHIVLPFTSRNMIRQFTAGNSVSDYRFGVSPIAGGHRMVSIRNEIILDNLERSAFVVSGLYIVSTMTDSRPHQKLFDLHGNFLLDLGRANKMVAAANETIATVQKIEIGMGAIKIATGEEIIPITSSIRGMIILENDLFAFSASTDQWSASWGVMDIEQNIIVEANYTFNEILSMNIIVPEYHEMMTNEAPLPWYYKLVEVNPYRTDGYAWFNDMGARGLKDSDGNVVIPAIYRALEFAPWIDEINQIRDYPFLNARTQTGWGLVDLRGTIVLPFTSRQRIEQFPAGNSVSDYRFIVTDLDTKQVVNIRNEVIAEGLSFDATIFNNMYIYSPRTDTQPTGKLLDLDGNIVLDLGKPNRTVTNTTDRFAVVRDVEQAFGVVEIATGKEIIPVTSDIVYMEVMRDELFVFSDGSGEWLFEYGLMDIHQNIIMSPEYHFSDILFVIRLRESPDTSVFKPFASTTRLHWFDDGLREILGTQELQILCLRSGRLAKARSSANEDYAKINGITPEYDRIMGRFRNVLVKIEDGTVMPAAMERSSPSTSFALHFYGTLHSTFNYPLGPSEFRFGEHWAELIEKYVF